MPSGRGASADPSTRRRGTAAAAAAPPRRPGRHTLTLKKLAAQIVARQSERRGLSLNATVNALVTEWELLRGVRRAEEWRREHRELLALFEAASDRERETVRARLLGQIALVTSL